MSRLHRHALLLSLLLVVTSHTAAAQATARLLVHKRFDSTSRAGAGVPPYRAVTSLAPARANYVLVADYLSRALYEGPAESLQQLSTDLRNEGYAVSTPADLDSIHLNGFIYDPVRRTTTSPPLPPGYTFQKADGLFVVALAGYPTAEWLTALRAANVRLVEALPPAGYLVRVRRTDASTLHERFPFVKAVFALTPGGKKTLLNPTISQASRKVFIQASEEQPQESIEEALRELSTEPVVVVARRAPHAAYTASLADTDIDIIGRFELVYSISGLGDPAPSSERQALLATRPSTQGTPLTLPSPRGPGYTQYLIDRGITSLAATTVAILDSGLDTGIVGGAAQHPDFVYSPAECIKLHQSADNCVDQTLHGTMTASIVAGYPPAGVDADGYVWGEGLAPTVRLIVDEFFECNSFKSVASGLEELAAHTPSQPHVVNYSINSSNCFYDGDSLLFDRYSRTNNWLFTVSAGNRVPFATQCPNPRSPATAKNAIAVGATHSISLSWPFDMNTHVEECDWCGYQDFPLQDARNIPTFSPLSLSGNMIKPDLVAAGTRITGALSRVAAESWCANAGTIFCNINLANPAGTNYWYGFSGGTSFSAPVAAGAAAVVRQWFTQTLRPGGNPSPALTKAMLINGARSVQGGIVQRKDFSQHATVQHITHDPYQGWGTVSFDRLLAGSANHYLRDQADAPPLGPGGYWQQAVTVVDGSKAVRITLVWTEQPGSAGSPYVVKNNLDLIAYNSACFPCFLGNKVNASTGYSVDYLTPPSGDSINNVEEVVIPPGYFPTGTVLTLLVQATSLMTNGLDAFGATSPLQQDFAVFVTNAH